MSGTTSVPQPIFTDNGLVIPTEAQILAGVLADLNSAFGGNLNPALETPQGQLATSETAILAFNNDLWLQIVNSVDPAYASGRMQDAIGRIYFLTRNPPIPTTVIGTCMGLVGAVIPYGSLTQAVDGTLYQSLGPVDAGGNVSSGDATIGSAGTVDVMFAATTPGPIACLSGELNAIYRIVPGWDKVSNNAPGVLGSNVESRASFELRRQQTVASNSIGMLDSVQGAVLRLGVTSVYTTENSTGSSVVMDGVTLPAHSLYVCVAGGVPADIAKAIWQKKSIGCATAGNTSVTVYDDGVDDNGIPFYQTPLPSYVINYQTAIPQNFVFEVTLAKTSNLAGDALTQIQNAVMNAWEGADGGDSVSIGATVYASRYYAAIASLGSWVKIIEIELGSSVGPSATFNATFSGTTMTVTTAPTGTLAVGNTIMSAAGVTPPVPDGTTITALGTGTGGTGTYTISNTFTQATAVATLAINPSQDWIAVGIAHIPTLVPVNIQLVLV